MIMKIFGAIFIIIGCGGVGYALIGNDRRKEQALTELRHCLQWMSWQLRYQMPPLPQLCLGAAQNCRGSVGSVLLHFADILNEQLHQDPAACMEQAIRQAKGLPELATQRLREMAAILGQFDLENQLSSMEGIEALCIRDLDQMRAGRDVRTRNYQTLSLCAGVALVILLL